MAGQGRLRWEHAASSSCPAEPRSRAAAPTPGPGPGSPLGKAKGHTDHRLSRGLALNLYVHIYEMGTIHPVVQRLPRHGLLLVTTPRMSLGGRKGAIHPILLFI